MPPALLKSTRVLILMLVLSNLLFGIIPAFAVPILREFENSIFMIVFIRFLVGGAVISIIVIFQLALNFFRIRADSTRFGYYQASLGDVKRYLFSRNAGFFNARRLVYIFTLGFFGVALNVVTYFIGLEKLSINLQLVGGPGGSIIIFSLYNLVKGKEKITLFKGVYLVLMVLSLIITVIATGDARDLKATGTGIAALAVNLVALFVLFNFTSADKPAAVESLVGKMSDSNIRMIRTLVKLALFMLFGAISIIPFVLFGLMLPGTYLHVLSAAFSSQIPSFIDMLVDPHMLGMCILSTAIAYLLLFLPATFWNTEQALSLNQWNSILYLLDPISGTSISMLLGFEQVDTTLMLITITILITGILLRFVHEHESKINAFIFIDIEFGKQKEVIKSLARFDEIRKYYWTTGQADVILKTTFGSMKEYHEFLAKLALHRTIKIKYDLISFVRRVTRS
ncbi:MAG: Lrp/AsnC ligand binding domain-containing protein [Promethearchaeota archaeon]